MEVYSFDHFDFPHRSQPHDLPIGPKIIRKCSRKHRKFRHWMPHILRYRSPRGCFHSCSPLCDGFRHLNQE